MLKKNGVRIDLFRVDCVDGRNFVDKDEPWDTVLLRIAYKEHVLQQYVERELIFTAFFRGVVESLIKGILLRIANKNT